MLKDTETIQIPTSFNENLFMQMLIDKKIAMQNFVYSTRIQLTTIGQTASYVERITTDDFLLKDIEIHGYDKNGPIYGIGLAPRDRFSLMMRNASSGKNFFNRAIDISHYSPLKSGTGIARVFPQVITAPADIQFEITHDPVVTGVGYGDLIDFDSPVVFEILMSGVKLFKNQY